MINKVVLVGRLTKDPELKSTQSNIYFSNFTLAVNRPFSDANGDKQADFIQCIVWRKPAENLCQYTRKGSLIGVVGRIETRTYESDQGTKYITEVVCDNVQFLESKGETNEPSPHDYLDTEDDFYETSKELSKEEDLPF